MILSFLDKYYEILILTISILWRFYIGKKYKYKLELYFELFGYRVGVYNLNYLTALLILFVGYFFVLTIVGNPTLLFGIVILLAIINIVVYMRMRIVKKKRENHII